MTTQTSPHASVKTEHPQKSQRDTSHSKKPDHFREHMKKKIGDKEEKQKAPPSIFDFARQGSPVFSQTTSDITCGQVENTLLVSALDQKSCEQIIEYSMNEITHFIENGNKETTITLGDALFKDSALSGLELTIKEFSTAPLAFNVSFRGSPSALALLAPHLPTLVALFHAEKKDFTVNRVDAELQDAPEFFFHRKSQIKQ